MIRNKETSTAHGTLISFLILLNTIFLKSAYVDDARYYWALLISLPLLVIAIWDRVKPNTHE